MSIPFNYKQIVIFVIIYIVLLLIMTMRLKKNLHFLTFFTLFFIYIVYVIDITQFPIYSTDIEREIIGSVGLNNGINLVPLKDFYNMTSVYNIILFIPFGFLLPFILKRNFQKTILLGFSFSFAVEMLQLIIAIIVGYPSRVTDINDLIFNTLGSVIGFIFFSIFSKIFKKIFKNSSDSFILYICNR